MGNFLVIGGSGVMGQAAIKAVRKKFGSDANIIAKLVRQRGSRIHS